jgi:Fic family protein
VLEPSTLAGYRRDFVFLRGSRHVPPRPEAVRDAMPVLLGLLAEETEPAVQAVLGHWLLGYFHPYPDANGRMARFLMNALLAGGGYPWTVVRVKDRATYVAALESASVGSDIRPFATFLTTCMLDRPTGILDRQPEC